MCWDFIDAKLDQHKYWDLQSFIVSPRLSWCNAILISARYQDDINLVLDNALAYNTSGSLFHRSATRLKRDSKNILADLEELRCAHQQPIVESNGEDHPGKDEAEEQESVQDSRLPPIGDLEPVMDILKLLLSSDTIKEDLNMELDDDPITSLFNYELAKVKPPPPEPPSEQQRPPPPPRSAKSKKGKPKRDRKAEAERREARLAAARAAAAEADMENAQNDGEGDEDEKMAPGSSSAFHVPRTRGGLAAAAAFEAEAHGAGSPSSSSADPSAPLDLGLTGEKPVSKGKKRPSIAPVVGQPSIPRVVSAVDNRDSFSMFNAGWILPPDQKRGGRPPASTAAQQSLPPPKKKQKIGMALFFIIT